MSAQGGNNQGSPNYLDIWPGSLPGASFRPRPPDPNGYNPNGSRFVNEPPQMSDPFTQDSGSSGLHPAQQTPQMSSPFGFQSKPAPYASSQEKGIIIAEDQQKGFNPTNNPFLNNPNFRPLNSYARPSYDQATQDPPWIKTPSLRHGSGVRPPMPTGPMQAGQYGWGFTGTMPTQPAGIGPTPQGPGYTPQFDTGAKKYIQMMLYGGGNGAAPWANQVDPNDMLGSIGKLSGTAYDPAAWR